MQDEIQLYLNGLSQDWDALKEASMRLYDEKSHIDEEGVVAIHHMPWKAPLAYGIRLYPPAQIEWVSAFEEQTGLPIPNPYRKLLSEVNGCFVFKFELFGLPASMYTEGVFNRSILQPFDLGTANLDWKAEYKIDSDFFHIGGRTYSFDENIGYFLRDERIYSIRKNGEILSVWNNFCDFLQEEIAYGERLAQPGALEPARKQRWSMWRRSK